MAIWLQTAIWSNRLKTTFLLILFPTILVGVVSIILFFASFNEAGSFDTNMFIDSFIWINSLLLPVIFLRAFISFLFHRQIIFAFTWARAITRKENPEIYNIVENLCISRGLSTPNIWILDDDSLNAFATWWNTRKAWIVFSRWILDKLNKQEIEAVAAHELTHIINKDWLIMITIICYIWAIAWLGEILIRMRWSSNSDSKEWNIFPLIWIILLILGYMVLPLAQLAVSRKREYLADAGSVELTHNNLALISALEKISQDSTIESIKKDTVSALCIANPFAKWGSFDWLHEFFSTHPSIKNRVEMLQKY